jgi:uncharacterized membrane protein
MSAILLEWLNALLRWAHVMTGIAWIGTSFFFIWLEASLKRRDGQPPGIAGETWMVHGGGFYLAEKYRVAPERMPDELHWFKYEAYFTWITGFLLLAVIYYLGAGAFLIDREKLPLDPVWASLLSAGSLTAGWFIYDALCKSEIGKSRGLLAIALFVEIAAFTFFYHGIFSDRAAFLHIGAMIGTIMAASVFFVIIPNQKIVVADLIAGRSPDPALGLEAAQRSLHNNYLTLPVVFLMISNHYPIMFGHPWSPLIALGIVLAGGLIRHFFNITNHGILTTAALASIPAAVAVLVVLIMITGYRPGSPGVGGAVAFADIHPLIEKHCNACHSARPTNADFPEAPKGVAFDTPDEIRRYADKIEQQTVLSAMMPLGNTTGMTEGERRSLGAWIDAGAPLR